MRQKFKLQHKEKVWQKVDILRHNYAIKKLTNHKYDYRNYYKLWKKTVWHKISKLWHTKSYCNYEIKLKLWNTKSWDKKS